MFHSFVVFSFCIICAYVVVSGAKAKREVAPKIQLDESKLPKLDALLEELSIGFKLKDFLKQGIIDTRYLIKLKPMDYQIMEMEWITPGDDKFTMEHLNKLKDKVKMIIADATIQPNSANSDTNIFNEKSTPYLELVEERAKYNYGRIYVNNSIQSFEFQLATFGGKTTPIGAKGMQMLIEPSQRHSMYHRDHILSTGCPPPEITNINLLEKYHKEASAVKPSLDVKDQYIVVKRGDCPFLLKAYHIKAMYPKSVGLIVVNHNDQIEAPSSGYGVDPLITEKQLMLFDNLGKNPQYSVLSISNSSWDRLSYTMFQQVLASSADFNKDFHSKLSDGSTGRKLVDTALSIHAIPLKCGYGLSASNAHPKSHSKQSKSQDKTNRAAKTAKTNSKFCRPLLPQEEMIASEVTAGTFSIKPVINADVVEPMDLETTITGDSESISVPRNGPHYDFLSGYVGGWLPSDRDVELVVADPIDGCSPLSLSGDTERNGYVGKAIVIKRGVCNFDVKLYNVQQAGGVVAVVVNNPGVGLEHIGIINNQLHISVSSVLIMHDIGLDLIKQLQVSASGEKAKNALTIRFDPYHNNVNHLINAQYEHSWDAHNYEHHVINTQYPTLAHHWIELVHYPWISVVDKDTLTQALLQIQVLIHKYELLKTQYEQYVRENKSYHENSENKLKIPLYASTYYDSILNWLESKKTNVLEMELKTEL